MSNPQAMSSNPALMRGMSTASISMQGLGSLMGAVNSFTSARNDKRAAKQNAQLAGYAASDAQYRGNLELQKVQRQGELIKGAQRARFAANAVDLTQGSAADVLSDTDYFSALDAKTVRENTAKETY